MPRPESLRTKPFKNLGNALARTKQTGTGRDSLLGEGNHRFRQATCDQWLIAIEGPMKLTFRPALKEVAVDAAGVKAKF